MSASGSARAEPQLPAADATCAPPPPADASTQTVVVKMRPADDSKKILGAVMIAFGAVGFVLGGAIDVGGLLMRTHDTGQGDVALGVGLTITGVGLALGIGGGYVVSSASTTDVSTKTESAAHPARSPRDDLYMRAPTWRAPDAIERAARAPAAIPIFSRSF
jgi:hypothetical protein